MTSIDTTHDDVLREVPFAKENIYNGRILHVEKWKVTCPNGRKAAREIVVHKGAAAVVPVFENGDTLLVRQHRVAVDRVTLEIPAGKLTPGEDPLECGKRELQEETGAAAARYEFLGKLYPSPGYCGEIIYMYMATGLTYGEMNPDEDEFLEVERIPLEKAAAMVLDGTITDAKTQAAVLKVYIKAKG